MFHELPEIPELDAPADVEPSVLSSKLLIFEKSIVNLSIIASISSLKRWENYQNINHVIQNFKEVEIF